MKTLPTPDEPDNINLISMRKVIDKRVAFRQGGNLLLLRKSLYKCGPEATQTLTIVKIKKLSSETSTEDISLKLPIDLLVQLSSIKFYKIERSTCLASHLTRLAGAHPITSSSDSLFGNKSRKIFNCSRKNCSHYLLAHTESKHGRRRKFRNSICADETNDLSHMWKFIMSTT